MGSPKAALLFVVLIRDFLLDKHPPVLLSDYQRREFKNEIHA